MTVPVTIKHEKGTEAGLAVSIDSAPFPRSHLTPNPGRRGRVSLLERCRGLNHSLERFLLEKEFDPVQV